MPKKPTSIESQAVAPPSGVLVEPPVDVGDTILNHSCPTLHNIEHLKQEDLSLLLESADIKTLEQRITLLSRVILEASLWNPTGLTKKERADLALNAIRLFEGTKNTLWVQDEGEAKMPKTMEVLKNEKQAIELRVMTLLEKNKDVQKRRKELLDAAVNHIEVTKGVEGVTNE